MSSTVSHPVDFSTILAAAIHDMKNSLSLMMESIESMAESLDGHDHQQMQKVHALHYETSRLNTGMVHLLALYRARQDKLPLNCDEHYVQDIWEDIFASNHPYFTMRGMSISTSIDESLSSYLDYDLIYVLLNDMVVNAMRYSNGEILFSASSKDQGIEILIEDDGPGYPEHMLNTAHMDMQQFDISSGRTGLGIYFARTIAQSHHRQQRTGFIKLDNHSRLGGSRFTLWLP